MARITEEELCEIALNLALTGLVLEEKSLVKQNIISIEIIYDDYVFFKEFCIDDLKKIIISKKINN